MDRVVIDVSTTLAPIVGSRDIAHSLRSLILKARSKSVDLDFKNVEFLSRSAAHELLTLKDELSHSFLRKKIVNFMATIAPIGRGLTVPPGVPQDRIEFLRAAFAKAVADPNFTVNAEKRKLRVKAATGAALQKIVGESLKVSGETVKRAQALIFGKPS